MGKGRRALKAVGIALLSLSGLFVVLTAALHILINSERGRNLVNDLFPEHMEARLEYSHFRISLFKRFPCISVEADSLSLTYPHGMFARYDSTGVWNFRLDEGRGELADTLAKIDRFRLVVNPWHFLAGRIRVRTVDVDGLGAYLHVYDDSVSNLSVLLPDKVEEPEDSSGNSPSLPWLSVRDLCIDRSPELVYTDQRAALFADLGFERLFVKGRVKFRPEKIAVRRFAFELDTLRLSGVAGGNSVDFKLDSLYLTQFPRRNDTVLPHNFKLALSADASADLQRFGLLNVPLRLKSDFGIGGGADSLDVGLQSLSALLAYIPLSASGTARIGGGKVDMDAVASVENADIADIWRRYGSAVLPQYAGRVRLNRARLDASASAKGEFSDSSRPVVNGDVNMDVDAPGLGLSAVARGLDLLCSNPALSVDMDAGVDVEPLLRNIPVDFGVSGNGDLSVKVRASARLAELQALSADLDARLASRSLDLSLPGEMSVRTGNLEANVVDTKATSTISGFVNLGRMRFRNSDRLSVYVMNMRNDLRMQSRSGDVTDLHELGIDDSIEHLGIGAGADRVGIRGLKISASASRRRDWLAFNWADTLRRSSRNPFRGNRRLDYLSEEDFRSSDISFDLDEDTRTLLQQWNPSASIELEGARIVTPRLPLRTKVNALDLDYHNDNFTINDLDASVGSSDMRVKGSFEGIGRVLRRNGLIKADLDIESGRINANELLAALEKGRSGTVGEFNGETEADEAAYEQSVVIDTLADISTVERSSLIVLPANVVAQARLLVDKVDWADLDVRHLTANAALRERTLQLTNTAVQTDAGNIEMEGYYYSRTKQDIAAAANLHLTDLTAEKIIRLLPAADSLMPMIRSFQGTMSADVALTTQLDTNMNVQLPKTDGAFRITGKDMSIKDAGELRRITRLLMFRNKNIGRLGDLYVDAIIHDNRIQVFPFIFKADRYTLALNGQQGLDRNFEYCATVLRWPLIFPFGINMFGSFDNWKFNFRLPRWKASNVPSFDEDIRQMQEGISASIHDVFRYGATGGQIRNKSRHEALERKMNEMHYNDSPEALKREFKEQIIDAVLKQEDDDEEEKLQKELDAMLSDIERDARKLDAEYQKLVKKK